MTKAQHVVLRESIKSMQVTVNGDPLNLPVVNIGKEDYLQVSFDDMTHEFQRYTYRIEHCESDWSLSANLLPNDYISGFSSDLVIDDFEMSSSTAMAYTHYKLRVPNDDCQIIMSGNYIMTITDDSNSEDVAIIKFMACDPKINASVTVSSNTDIDIHKSHQQLSVRVAYNGLSVTQPERQIKTVVMQNNRMSTARLLRNPKIVMHNAIKYEHDEQLIFPATNEYRKFELLDIHRSSMGVEQIIYDGENYHAYLFADVPRPNYSYDEDANGAYVIRNTHDLHNDTQSEYFMCHFTYIPPAPFKGDVYLNGMWTNDSFGPAYKMHYDAESQAYHFQTLLKMGYYSYQYLLDDSTELKYLPSEGNFHETENVYTVFVYYRPVGGRTDLLYSVANVHSGGGN